MASKKRGDLMSEKEVEMIQKLSSAVKKLDNNKQSYILGVAEGMAISKGMDNKEAEMKRREVSAGVR